MENRKGGNMEEIKKKIVVADDDYAILSAIKETLEDEYTVHTADDGREAVKLVTEIMPDLVIMDITMPRMDGHEACRLIKKDKNTSSIPIMFLTGKNQLGDTEKAYSSGADSYMVKPFSPDKLLQKVAEMIQKSELRKGL